MTEKVSPFVEAKWGWSYGESGWNTGMDENLLKFSFLFDANIDNIVESLPTATSGQSYFLTTDKRFYFSANNTWYSSPVPLNFVFKIKSTGASFKFDGNDVFEIPSVEDIQAEVVDIVSEQLTPSNIKNLYESNDDTNVFTDTDLDKLEKSFNLYQPFSNSTEYPINSAGSAIKTSGTSAVQVFRQELQSQGQDIVYVNQASLSGFYGEKVSIESFGAVPGADISDAIDAAVLALTSTDKILYLPNTVYQITRTVDFKGINVFSDGCEIQKNFDGVGIMAGAGPDYFDLEGVIYLRGVGPGFYDPTLPGAVAPANPNAHGFWFNSGRVRIRGRVICQNHQGDLFRFTCAGNMNKTNIESLWGFWGGRGVYFEGTQDDFSVCRLDLYMQFTWGSGISTSADFMGRGWRGFWYSEGCSIDGVSPGMDIKKLRTSDLEVYCEQQNAALELVLGTACTDNRIRSQRRNKDQDLSGSAGRNSWLNGTRIYNPGFIGDTRTATPLVTRSDRARPTTPGEFVDHLFEASSTALGSIRGEGGATSPYIKMRSANGAGVVSLANDDFSVTVGGLQQLKYRTTGITLGTGSFSATGATNGKEVDSTTTSLKSSRNDVAARDHIEFYNPNGKVGGISTTATSTTYATASDARLKENIKSAESSSELIDAIKVVQYDWKATGQHEQFGVIAQDLEIIYPVAVSVGETYMVDFSKLVPILLKEIQELRKRVSLLEN